MPEVEVREFEELMAGLAAGSDEAAWQLTEKYTPHIVRAVRASLPTKLRRLLDTQDFTQAVWASLLLKRVEVGRIQSEKALIGYLAQTARNKVVDECRKYLSSAKRDINRDRTLSQTPLRGRSERREPRRVPVENEPYSATDTPSQCAMLRERWRGILATEPERNRQILELRLKGESFATVASELGIHEGTARRAVLQIINKLTR